MFLFRNESTFETYKAGDTIFNQGDAASTMYAVRSGTVHIVYNDDVLNVIEAENFFGEMGLVDGSPRVASAVAVTDVEVVVIDEDRFMQLVHTTPFFALSVLRTTVKRLRNTMHFYGED